MILVVTGTVYILSLTWLGASLCNPFHPYIESIAPAVAVSALLCGIALHRRLYGKRG